MARSKKRRTNMVRSYPFNVDSARHTQAVSGSTSSSLRLLLEDLSSPIEEKRVTSAKQLVSLLQHFPAQREFVEQGSCQKLLDRLTDSSTSVLHDVSFALRCITCDTSIGEAACEELIEANCLPLLNTCFETLHGGLAISDTQTEQSCQIAIAIVENLMSVIWSLCETLEDDLPSTMRKLSLSFIVVYTDLLRIHSLCSTTTLRLASECFTSLTCCDDAEVILDRACSSPDFVTGHRQLSGNTNPDISIPSISVLQTILYDTHTKITLSDRLGLLGPLFGTLGQFLQEFDGVLGQDPSIIEPDPQKSSTLAICQIALEVLGRMAVLPTGLENSVPSKKSNSQPCETWSKVIVDAFLCNLHRPLMSLATPRNIPDSLAMKSEMDMIVLLSLDALHNAAWTLAGYGSQYSSDWQSGILVLWNWALALLNQFLVMSEDISDSAISLLYGLAKNATATLPVDTNTINSFIKLYHASLNAEIQTKIVGLLGCLAGDQGSIDNNKMIGTFLITVVASLPRSDTDVVIEALNALFDIYADQEFAYDQAVFKQYNFLSHLEASMPKVRTMTAAINRRSSRSLWERAQETLDNLVAFVAYKRSEA